MTLVEYFSNRIGSVTLAAADEKSAITFSHRGTPHVLIMLMLT